ncbi:MAG: hypothetical protein AAF737_03390 [Pseudomonadota bacterium]
MIRAALTAFALCTLSIVPAHSADGFNFTPTPEAGNYACRNLDTRGEITEIGQPMYQGDNGIFFRRTDFVDRFAMAETTRRFLSDLKEVLAAGGTTLVMLTLPPKGLANSGSVEQPAPEGAIYDPVVAQRSYEAYVNSLRTAVPLTVNLLEHVSADEIDGFYYKRDLHWRPEAARLAAKAIADLVEPLASYQALEKQSFTSQVTDPDFVFRPKFSVALRLLCDDPLPDMVQPFWTTQADEASLDGLLGPSTVPVALVGTSFSVVENPFNFEGFLQEALQLDTANFAIGGGGIDQSIYQWSHTARPPGEEPAFLVWELPFIQRIEAMPDLTIRQIVPAAKGMCSDEEAIFATEISLPAQGPVEVDISTPNSIVGDDFYIAAELSNGALRVITTELTYEDGEAEFLPIARPERVPSVDQLFLRLSDEFDAPLTSITLDASTSNISRGIETQARLHICRLDLQKTDQAANNENRTAPQ